MGSSLGTYELNHGNRCFISILKRPYLSTVPWDPNKILFQTLIKLTASRSMKAFRYFNDARFNFYKDDVFCITKHLLNVSIFRFISFGLASSNCKLQYQRQKLSVAVLGQKRPKY